MFCEKCGTDNRDNATVCSRCGEKMPATSSCGGFGDILSYEGKIPSAAPSSAPSVPSEKFNDEIRKLKAENAGLKNKVRTLSRQALISLCISCIAVALSAIAIFSNQTKDDTKTDVSEVSSTSNPAEENMAIVDTTIKDK